MGFTREHIVLLRTALTGLLLLAFTAGAYAQTGEKGKIAILPFSGGEVDEQEGIAEMFLISPELRQIFDVMPRTGITAAAKKEQAFQAASGMTDADTIEKLGNDFGADYVMAGSITSLGEKKLLIVSIVQIETIQQAAGAYHVYDTLDELNSDETIVNGMAAKMVELTQKSKSGFRELALMPVEFPDGTNKAEGDALAQLLAIHLLESDKYAVYPRTKNLEQMQSEAMSGNAKNPPYALSIISRKIGTGTRFNSAIIDIAANEIFRGRSEQYVDMSDGMNAMDFLARELSGQKVSEKERTKRAKLAAKGT